MTGWTALLEWIAMLEPQMIATAALVLLRVGAMVAVMPAFGDQMIPARIRLMLALALAAMVAPTVWERLPKGGHLQAGAAEVLAGLALGIGLRLLLLALQTSAAIIAQSTSLSQLMGGAAPEPQPAVGHLLTLAALAIAMSAGLPLRVVEYLLTSYDLVPPGTFPDAANISHWVVVQVGRGFSLAFTLAAPFTIAALLYNLALGAINRAMPTLMVSLVGAPALAGVGLAGLASLMPLMLGNWWRAVLEYLANPALALP